MVTGYGNFTKSSFTGSANTLRADMMKDVPVMSVEQKLQGMTTGVSITGSSGQPGANQSIRIRGMGSFNASQEPLFVIDGVPVTSGSLSTGGFDASYMNNSKTNIMSTLNPSDIENITVIKDAAAASLYGSRAANGVILITTKQGRQGKARATRTGARNSCAPPPSKAMKPVSPAARSAPAITLPWATTSRRVWPKTPVWSVTPPG